MSLQPASMISPLTQQMSHLSLGSTGTVCSNLIQNRTYPSRKYFMSITVSLYSLHVGQSNPLSHLVSSKLLETVSILKLC